MEMARFENHEEMFSQSIVLKDPWKVKRAEFDEEKREVHIYRQPNTHVQNAEKCVKDMMTRKLNEYGDMEMLCFSHAMCIVEDQE